MDKTILQVPHDQCTGCGACYNKCPVDAIKMQENAGGFLSPVIDTNLCVQCGLCTKSCPALNMNVVRSYKATDPDCYAMMADEEIRSKSSSGGMFSVLANFVLQRSGLVCGAAYTDDYMQVRHIVVDNPQDLAQLRGSKYVQSDTQQTYRTIETHLKNGGWALYTGTPCQIAGIRMYLQKEYDRLILVDIVCHGGPSPKAYRKYLEEKAWGRKIIRSDFRDKSYWGWGTATSLFFEDGTSYRGDCYKDLYWRAFLGGLSTRECCGTCEYADSARIGDFTLGDFWGVDTLDSSCADGRGTTLLLVNSQKARDLLPQLSNIQLLKRMDYSAVKELAKTRNGQLLHPKAPHQANTRFLSLLDSKPFSTAFDYAVNRNFDVGITGWWYNENYGGTLTYFALNRVLEAMGQSVLMIGKCSDDPNYKPNYNSVPYRFALKHYQISKNYSHANIGTLSDRCKVFISGSDQLFNPTLWPYSGPQYFLNYVRSNRKIISYASSFGDEFDNRNLRIPMGYWLRRFDAISVRETYGVDICRNTFGIEATKVMDPVFLCDVREYEKLAEQTGKTKEHPYFVNFILDPNDEKRELILSLREKLAMPYVNLVNADHAEENAKHLNLENTFPNADLEEWLFYYRNADFIVTDSFHGTCFAIIFRKNFISLANRQRGANRFISVLEEAGLIDRLVWDISEIPNRPELFENIDYDRVYQTLTPKIQESMRWLETAVKSPKISPVNDFTCLNYEIERLAQELARLRKLEDMEKQISHNLRSLQEENERSRQLLAALQQERERKKGSWLCRKFKGLLTCCKDHGLLYTWNLFWKKVRSKLK